MMPSLCSGARGNTVFEVTSVLRLPSHMPTTLMPIPFLPSCPSHANCPYAYQPYPLPCQLHPILLSPASTTGMATSGTPPPLALAGQSLSMGTWDSYLNLGGDAFCCELQALRGAA